MQHISLLHPKTPCPWHLPGDQVSLHLSPTPSTAPSTSLCPLCCQPEHGELSFAFSGHCRRSRGLGKAREDGELPPLNHRSLPSRS